MTLKDMQQYIDKPGWFHTTEGLVIPVKIIDVRCVFGRIDVRIVPVGGNGVTWVMESRVAFNKGE